MEIDNLGPKSLIDHPLEIQVSDDSITFTNLGASTINNVNITGREMYRYFGFSAFGLDDTHAPQKICEGHPVHVDCIPPNSQQKIKPKMWFSLKKYVGPDQFLIDATFTVSGQTWPSSARFVPVRVKK